jgi:hypothetical protein
VKIPKIHLSLVIAAVVLFVALSGTALAATSGFILHGGAGNKANVTKYGQLLATEASPGDHVNRLITVNDSQCTSVYPIPAGKAFVITDVTFYMEPDTSQIGQAALFTNGCIGTFTGIEGLSSEAATVSYQLGPGMVVPGGTTMYAYGFYTHAQALISGYLVPAADAASATLPHAPLMRASRVSRGR